MAYSPRRAIEKLKLIFKHWTKALLLSPKSDLRQSLTTDVPHLKFFRKLPVGASFSAQIKTSSMIPAYVPGEVVTLQKISFSQLRVNDVIAFTVPGCPEMVTHRVVRISGKKTLTTKGDHNVVEDKFPVTEENYLGKVIKTKKPQ